MKKSYVFFAIVLAMIVSCKENKKKVEENQQKTVVKKLKYPYLMLIQLTILQKNKLHSDQEFPILKLRNYVLIIWFLS